MADDTYKTGADDARIKILRDEFYRQAGHSVAGLSDNKTEADAADADGEEGADHE